MGVLMGVGVRMPVIVAGGVDMVMVVVVIARAVIVIGWWSWLCPLAWS